MGTIVIIALMTTKKPTLQHAIINLRARHLSSWNEIKYCAIFRWYRQMMKMKDITKYY